MRLGKEKESCMTLSALRRLPSAITKDILVSEAPCAQAITLIPLRPKNVEQFSGNTGRMLHILAHDSYGGKIFLGFDRTNFTNGHIVAELFAQYFHRQLGIGIAHGKCRIVFGRCLRHQKTLIPDFASRLNIRELIPMTPTMPIPDKVMRHVSLIDEIPFDGLPLGMRIVLGNEGSGSRRIKKYS